MRVLPVLLVLLAPTAFGEEIKPEDRAFVEVVVPDRAVYAREVFPLRVRIGYDRAFFSQHGVSLFRQEMDLPVQISAPWLRETGTLTLVRKDAAGGTRLALNDDVVEAAAVEDVTRSGRTYGVVELAWTCQSDYPGTVAFPASLRFAHATRFEEDFVGGRVALDRRDAAVAAAPSTVEIRRLPEGPKNFSGAVGDFEIRSEADRAAVEVGEIFRVTLTITGKGNLETFGAPAFADDAGFHVYGRSERVDGDTRTVVYEVAATRADVERVPPFDLVMLRNGQLMTTWTAPIPIKVSGSSVPAPVEPAKPQEVVSRPQSIATWVVLALGAGILIGFFLRRRPRPEPAKREPAPAASVAPTDVPVPATPDGDLAAFLAARLGITSAAVIAPDLRERLVAAGIDAELAERTARTLEALVASRYGGAPTATEGPEEIRAALARAFDNTSVRTSHSDD